MLKYLLLPFLLLFITACSNDEQSTASVDTATSRRVADTSVITIPNPSLQRTGYKLVFFLNPNGGPCRTQNAILEGMADELGAALDIQYVKTTVQEDLNIFSRYGIRSLPMLLLADANGKEVKRLPPGIRSENDIRLLLQSMPRS